MGGTEDNEVSSPSERKRWIKKWSFINKFSKMIKSSSTPPSWASSYIAQGVLHIPYAEIDEPFYAWVDIPKGRSRIDFYGGKTFLVVIQWLVSFSFSFL